MPNLRPLLTIIMLLAFSAANAQRDTTFFDAKWEPTKLSANSRYFRVVERSKSGNFAVTDYYYSTHSKQMAGFYKSFAPDVRQGVFIFYDSLGNKTSEGKFINDKHEGEWKEFREDDKHQLWRTVNYVNDVEQGVAKTYYKNGKLKREENYKNGELTGGKKYSELGKEMPFTQFFVMPEAPINVTAYLQDSTVYPKQCINDNISGRVEVKFVVNKQGKIRMVKAMNSVHPLIDAEAVRVVRAMPDWKPGIKDDEIIDFYYTVPIKFSLK